MEGLVLQPEEVSLCSRDRGKHWRSFKQRETSCDRWQQSGGDGKRHAEVA